MINWVVALALCFIVPIFSVCLAKAVDSFKAYNEGKFEIEYFSVHGSDIATVLAFTIPDRGHLVSFGDGNLYAVKSVVHKHKGADFDPTHLTQIEITLGEPK